MKNKLIVIGGPTASGKTALAIRLAKQFQTEIISADSRQFYKEISIGTAKPTPEELAEVKHHFINSHSITESFNSGAFADAARILIDNLFKKHEVVIIVGGSGLYIKSLLEGFDDLPYVEENIRTNLKNSFKENGIQHLLDELKKSDPAYFEKVDQHNHQRVMRALEIIRASGKPYSSFLGNKNKNSTFDTECYCLDISREILYNRINIRVDEMMKQGLEAEAKSVLPYRNHTALQTVGYKELFDYFDGNISLEESISLIKQHTRNYAKRQLTWFKHQGDFKFVTADSGDYFDELDFFIKQ